MPSVLITLCIFRKSTKSVKQIHHVYLVNRQAMHVDMTKSRDLVVAM